MYEVPSVERPRHRSWLLLLGWLIAYAVGWAITIPVQEEIVSDLRRELNMSREVHDAFSGMVAGVTLGLPLWLVVRRRTSFWTWMGLHILSWGIAIPGFELIDDFAASELESPLQGLLLGLLMGGAHYLALRRGYERAIWMLAATLLGWTTAVVILVNGGDDLTNIIAITALPGGLPGATLAWILRPRP